MRKLLIALVSVALMAVPVRADEAELLARIEALEQRVAQLEQLIGPNKSASVSKDASGSTIFELGAYVCGEDFDPGKYDIIAISGHGTVKIYDSYEDYNNSHYHHKDFDLIDQAFLDDETHMMHDYYVQFYSVRANNIKLDECECLVIDSGLKIQLVPVE